MSEMVSNQPPESSTSFTFGDFSKGTVALIIYEQQDLQYIGASRPNSTEIQYICDDSAVASNLCTNSTLGSFIVTLPASVPQNATSIRTKNFDFVNNSGVEQGESYLVNHTGYYCTAILTTILEGGPMFSTFSAVVEWQNPYGELPAVEYPKLLFYGIFSLVYLTIAVLWMIQSIRYWRDILAVQVTGFDVLMLAGSSLLIMDPNERLGHDALYLAELHLWRHLLPHG
ncbi:lung seven transmembrane receptor-domain-containing protein [Jimgerdemannia flammicorona]|uniref:Lung seven transmembrane receptor-domain-containing protein n=2 Tax=Jimgerdemannia flammicorona TaxID=994334 RepID=A0A433AHR0_9FUNG|nr:lung seven transmembrane receptor-domain-containing protein [Jimgerdemannia flammicorona]RUS19699.1 lung seven transmembrane receptor-domain-containing protein [Jimgerdemannia flammicorona]